MAEGTEQARETSCFWSRVQKSEGCWEWTASRTGKGYGRHGQERAHRYAWRITYGDPGALFVCHRCDNPACVRPDHLFLGTALGNNQDRQAKGRGNGAIGGRNANAKLSAADAAVIRAILADAPVGTAAKLARQYGVNQTVISRIKTGTGWRHA